MRILLLLIIVLFCFKVQAQNYTMFWNTISLYNPAYSGLSQKYYGALIDREQWVGFEGAPFTGTTITDLKIDALHGGVGMNFTYDKIGLLKSKELNLNYNYQINLQNERIISMGVSAGLVRAKLDVSAFMFPPGNDPLLLQVNDKVTLFNFKFGLFYLSNHLELGLSSTHVSGSEFGSHTSKISSNYWMVCSYRFDVGESFAIKPNVLLKANSSDNGLSSGLIVMFKERFWAGMSYTVDGSTGFMAGFDIRGKVRLGYSFDKYTQGNYNSGNNEIILAVMLK